LKCTVNGKEGFGSVLEFEQGYLRRRGIIRVIDGEEYFIIDTYDNKRNLDERIEIHLKKLKRKLTSYFSSQR